MFIDFGGTCLDVSTWSDAPETLVGGGSDDVGVVEGPRDHVARHQPTTQERGRILRKK